MTDKTTRWAVVRLARSRRSNDVIVDTWRTLDQAEAEAMHLNLHTKTGDHIVQQVPRQFSTGEKQNER